MKFQEAEGGVSCKECKRLAYTRITFGKDSVVDLCGDHLWQIFENITDFMPNNPEEEATWNVPKRIYKRRSKKGVM